ncbi:MAG: DUF6049 family protein, partial [Micrococcales bacterium]|nr:DUF6049 family protein [Micrococcales bacterium]
SPKPPASPTPSTPGSTESPGSPLLPATRALTNALATELRGRSVWALPYADADLAAAAEIDPTDPIVRDLVTRADSLTTRLDQPVRSDVAWPVDELLPPGREAELKQLYARSTRGGPAGGPAAIIVRQDAISAASPYTPTAIRVTSDGTRLLASDPGLSAALPTTEYAAGLSIQRYLADTLVLLGERPGTPRTILVAAPRTWNPEPAALASFLAATDVPWLTRVDASTLLDSAQPAPQPEQTTASPPEPSVPPAALTPARLAHLEAQRQNILRVATVLRDGVGFERTYRELIDELTSARWRYAPQEWTTLSRALDKEVRAATSAIKVIPRGVNFLAESGILQITVANGLDYEVSDIRLVLSPTNPRMQIVEQPEAITIGAGSLTTVRVPVTAVAAGPADIRAILTTADGTPIGQGAIIPVSANPLDAEIYWIGGIVAALILIAGVLRTILRGTSRIEEIGEGIDELADLAGQRTPDRATPDGDS